MLRLCQDETNWSKAAEWLQKIEDLHRAQPLEREKIMGEEFNSLGDLAIIVTFFQSLSSVEPLPAINHKKEPLSMSKFSALENEIKQLKTGVDLGDFCIPIDNLLEPGMASGALTALDEYLLERTGTKLGFLYEDLMEDCVSTSTNNMSSRKRRQARLKWNIRSLRLQKPRDRGLNSVGRRRRHGQRTHLYTKSYPKLPLPLPLTNSPLHLGKYSG